MYKSFEEIIAALHGSADRKRMVAAWGVDGHTIAAAAEAVKQGIADVTLVGDKDMISKACADEGVSEHLFTVVHNPDEMKSIAQAVQMIRDGEGDFLMKGLCSTDKFLRAILNKETGEYDKIASEHAISAVGYDIDIDVSDPDEGVWLERRTNRGYQKVVKASVLHSDPGRVEFVVDGELPPRKYAVAVYTRCGRGKSYKVVCCRHEVSIIR